MGRLIENKTGEEISSPVLKQIIWNEYIQQSIKYEIGIDPVLFKEENIKYIKCRRKGYNSMLGIDENTRRKDTKRIS